MFYIKSGVFNSREFKNDPYLHFRVSPTPARAPPGGGGRRGGGLEGGLIPYCQKSCVISILGFSLVGYSKMILIFILWYSQPPQGHPRGGGRKPRGGLSPTPPKIMFYINLRVFNSGEYLHFHFRCPPSPARALPEGGG